MLLSLSAFDNTVFPPYLMPIACIENENEITQFDILSVGLLISWQTQTHL